MFEEEVVKIINEALDQSELFLLAEAHFDTPSVKLMRKELVQELVAKIVAKHYNR